MPVPQATETAQQMDEGESMMRDGLDIFRNSAELIACLDGSYDAISCKASFNWRNVNSEEEGLTLISAPIMTNPKYLNSYRAEFAGLRSLIRYLKKHGLHRKKITMTINCDANHALIFCNVDLSLAQQMIWRRLNTIQSQLSLNCLRTLTMLLLSGCLAIKMMKMTPTLKTDH